MSIEKKRYYKQIFTPDLVEELDQLSRHYPLAGDWRDLVTPEVLDEILEDFQDIDEYLGDASDYYPASSQGYLEQAQVAGEDINIQGWAEHLCEDIAENRGECAELLHYAVAKIYDYLREDRVAELEQLLPCEPLAA
jgi:hypothetical protein